MSTDNSIQKQLNELRTNLKKLQSNITADDLVQITNELISIIPQIRLKILKSHGIKVKLDNDDLLPVVEEHEISITDEDELENEYNKFALSNEEKKDFINTIGNIKTNLDFRKKLEELVSIRKQIDDNYIETNTNVKTVLSKLRKTLAELIYPKNIKTSELDTNLQTLQEVLNNTRYKSDFVNENIKDISTNMSSYKQNKLEPHIKKYKNILETKFGGKKKKQTPN